MSAIGAQGVELLNSMIFMGFDPSLLDREGLMQEITAGGEINYPWLISLSAQMGNAYTAGLARTANIFTEPEWGWDTSGGNQNWQGAGGHGAVGGTTIWW